VKYVKNVEKEKKEKMVNKLLKYIKRWWKKHIADDCPSNLEDEFTNKFR
jgi:hemerythrin